MDAAGELAQLVERELQLGAAGLERGHRGRRGGRGRDPERERERDEPLLRAVVQVALDPAARLVGRLDDAHARRLELDPGVDVGDRLPDELGERAEARLGVAREGRAGGPGRHGAPQPPVDDDRRADRRPHPQRAQLGRVLARHALVGVHPGGRERRLDPRERRRAADLICRPVGNEPTPGSLQSASTVARPGPS